MSRLVLYRALGSPPARAVSMLGELLKLKMEIKEVNIIKFAHKTPEFKKLNPMCTVPVLQDGDFVVAESHAIMKYLLSAHGGAGAGADDVRERLYPSGARARAIVDQCLFFDTGVFFTAFREAASSLFYDGLLEPTARHKERIESAYEVVESYLARAPYVAADRLTIADLSCGSTATAMQTLHKLDPERFPRFNEWMKRLEQEHVFNTINKEGVMYFGKLIDFIKKNNAP